MHALTSADGKSGFKAILEPQRIQLIGNLNDTEICFRNDIAWYGNDKNFSLRQ